MPYCCLMSFKKESHTFIYPPGHINTRDSQIKSTLTEFVSKNIKNWLSFIVVICLIQPELSHFHNNTVLVISIFVEILLMIFQTWILYMLSRLFSQQCCVISSLVYKHKHLYLIEILSAKRYPYTKPFTCHQAGTNFTWYLIFYQY